MKTYVALFAAALCITTSVFAEDEEQAPLSQEVLDQLAALPDNTGAINPSDATADIVQNSGESSVGTIEGEITIRRTSAGVDVFNGLNKVESITSNSDGWIGQIVDNGSSIEFTPNGRPQLHCPSQSLSNWFGPCKVEAAS